ncbi:thiol-disulfide oxidoreductase DCC family protein [Flavobacterium agricola]|uniref:Thiol-disulfide oxidoreductase DCC family protein n=1 Tax=Flavobacterium agricola TaxID=2870839 RepID=A0ABY6M2Q3_9FLAO|nr:thiol-disulfide oxidoreductase DCC family protein [Flavobacterium agricola]UYW02040.1 thiol-disulfide oxidoreductase DCC family protein [Flavobacterium agricola]
MTFPEGKKIVLFDGVCNFCNDTVNTIIEHDKNDVFVFAALQSEVGQQIIKHIGLNPKIDSIVLYEPGVAYYIKADAALRIFSHLGSKFFYTKFFQLFPNGLKNIAYDYFAKNRYKWYGKSESCRIPTPAEKAKFL